MVDLEAYYRGSLRERLTDLESKRDAWLAGEAQAAVELRRLAHTLKGTGSSYGFPRVTRAAEAVIEAPDVRLADAVEEMLETVRRVASGVETAQAAPAFPKGGL